MKFLISCMLLISIPSWAKTYDLSNRFGIGVNGGYTFPVHGNDFDDFAKNDMMLGAHLRYHFTAEHGLMFNFSSYDFENTNINAKVMDLMYINRINEGDRLTPILGIGAGVADLNHISPYKDNLKFAARARAGFEYAITSDLFADIYVDYQFVGRMPSSGNTSRSAFPGREIFAVAPQIGLTWFFGPDKEIDDGKKEDKKKEEKPKDDDNDGVANNLDQCPNTPVGKQVNEYGCMKDETVSMRLEVLFPTGQTNLNDEANPHLDKLARFMNEHPETKLEVQGHTDNTGSETRNRKISEERANAVKNYLIEEAGISPSRITAHGYGASKPIRENTSEEGRAENRRVIGVITQ